MSNVVRWKDVPSAKPRDLQTSDGGGTFDDMSTVDAKIAAAEARTDTKFADLKGVLGLINARLDNIEKATSGLRLNTWLAAATALGLAFAAMALGAAQFGNGVMVTSAAVQDAQQARRLGEENAVQLKQIRGEIESLVQTLLKQPAP